MYIVYLYYDILVQFQLFQWDFPMLDIVKWSTSNLLDLSKFMYLQVKWFVFIIHCLKNILNLVFV